jgi:hypothetical protein
MQCSEPLGKKIVFYIFGINLSKRRGFGKISFHDSSIRCPTLTLALSLYLAPDKPIYPSPPFELVHGRASVRNCLCHCNTLHFWPVVNTSSLLSTRSTQNKALQCSHGAHPQWPDPVRCLAWLLGLSSGKKRGFFGLICRGGPPMAQMTALSNIQMCSKMYHLSLTVDPRQYHHEVQRRLLVVEKWRQAFLWSPGSTSSEG